MEALRSIVGTARRRPAKLAYFVISLGLSFGFIAAVATLVHANWFRLPAGVADRAYVTALRETPVGIQSISVRDFDEIVANVPEISWFYEDHAHWLTMHAGGSSGAPVPLKTHLVSLGYFEHLGVRPELGTLVPSGGDPAAVITGDVWRRVYGRRDVVGELLTTEDGTSVPIIGVTSESFVGLLPYPKDVWVISPSLPLSVPPRASLDEDVQRRVARRSPTVTVFGVIPEDTDSSAELAAARARLAEHRFDSALVVAEVEHLSADGDSITSRIAFSFGFGDSDRLVLGPGLETSPDGRRDVVKKANWLVGVVAMLLLMAFVSVVEFLLAEHVSREDEQKVRVALGAAPMDLFGRAFVENLVLGLAMWGIGWLAAGYVLDVLLRVEPFSTHLGELSAASHVIGLGSAGVLLALAFLICLGYVSWLVSRSSAVLAHSGRWLRRTSRQLLLLVGTASLVLVLSLAGRYLGEARLSLGFANVDVVAVTVRNPNAPVWAVPEQRPLAVMVDAIEAIPGVRAASAAMLEPLAPREEAHVFSHKVLGFPGLEEVTFYGNEVTPSFFRTLGVELLAGRVFDSDNRGEVVISLSAAEALGGIEVALGAPLTLEAAMGGESEVTVVGVVGEVPYGDYSDGARPTIYEPRVAIGPQDWLIDAEPGLDLAAALAQLPDYGDREIEIGDTPAQRFRKQFLAKRSVEVVLAMAAGFALVLALSGVGNSLARNIAETRSRIGIRLALGATPAEVALAQSATSVRELVVATAVVGGAGIAAKWWAPAFTEALDLWWLAPAFVCLALVCILLTRFLMGQLARRHTISALVDGSVVEFRGGASI